MPANVQACLATLVQFSRLAAMETDPVEMLQQLVKAAVGSFDVLAAVALQLSESEGFHVVAQENAVALQHLRVDLDAVGPALGETMRQQLGDTAAVGSRVMPLMAAGDMFGVLVLFTAALDALNNQDMELLSGLVDVAATVLGRSFQRSRFDATYAELARSRRILAHGEKLRVLGQMAAGVSHDLKNIFNPLALQLQLLRRRVGQEAANVIPIIDAMEQVIQHGLERVEKLRAFSRQTPEADRRAVVRLDDVLREVVDLSQLRAARPEHPITIAVNSHARCQVFLDASELVGALVNLVNNGIDAMPHGGTITLSAGDDKDGCWVRVSDTGPGIPVAVQARIFEPFFTTKGEQGTGLGLAMVYAFVQRCMGSVVCTSGADGTTFTLHFPSVPT